MPAAAVRLEDPVPLFTPKDPLDEITPSLCRLPLRDWKKLDAIASVERERGAASPFPGTEISRNTLVRYAIEEFISKYEEEHGQLQLSAEPEELPPPKKGGRHG